jgi:hypothetical protein
MTDHSRCQLCGSSVKDGRLILDIYFWLQSATYEEIEHFSESCAWCGILKNISENCLTDEERKEQGVLDWGKKFKPVWRVPGKAEIEFDVFATGKS